MQVALAWLLQRSPNILLIPGTSSVEHLRENISAAQLQIPAAMIEKFEASEIFKEDLSESQITNLAEYFVSLPSEIAMKLWTVLGDSDNINNVVSLHKAETTAAVRVSDHLVEILGGNTED